ncbi:hypothetical protein [Achromobacter dolens]|uniref:hypothetical protein n=1 Tax=Achromobacter dolens TaxID=1287738 RepID=UPI001F0EC0EB|nr:hypothetical protein [Achromobacter dolens]
MFTGNHLMGWLRRWERDDPAKVLERKQDQQIRRRAWVNWKEIRIDPFGAVWFGKEQVMTREESEQIEALVMVWFRWTRAYRPNLGVGRVSIYARGMRESVETDADEIDQRLAATQAEQVDVCIDSLRWQLRAAIGIHAGNKAAGACVFSNPRLTPEQQHAAYQEAKAELMPLLRKRGLIRSVPNVASRACVIARTTL